MGEPDWEEVGAGEADAVDEREETVFEEDEVAVDQG